MERTVGWFVLLAGIIFIGAFVWYLYSTAERKGWFERKINYATTMASANGLKLGDPVKLLGFNVGEITEIIPNEPGKSRGVTIAFTIRKGNYDYYGYVWLDSTVRVVSDFLGHTYLEVSSGRTGAATVSIDKATGKLRLLNRFKAYAKFKEIRDDLQTNNPAMPAGKVSELATNEINKLLKPEGEYYLDLGESKYDRPVNVHLTNWIYLPLDAAPSLSDRLEAVASKVELALPNLLNLTNQIGGVLSNANLAVQRLDKTLASVQPIVTNVTTITENLRNPEGSLGEWLIPTNINSRLQQTLDIAQLTLKSAHTTLDNTDTNISTLAGDLDKTLIHLADLTSNLNWQVQSNTNLVSEINTTIAHTDDLVQGLKREWFLRGAFKKKTPKK